MFFLIYILIHLYTNFWLGLQKIKTKFRRCDSYNVFYQRFFPFPGFPKETGSTVQQLRPTLTSIRALHAILSHRSWCSSLWSLTNFAFTLPGLQTVIIKILSQAIKRLHSAPHKVLLITRLETSQPPWPTTRCLLSQGPILQRMSGHQWLWRKTPWSM